ncbi:MAG: M3 family metallopeptidase [Hyphomonadaceae bacterium]
MRIIKTAAAILLLAAMAGCASVAPQTDAAPVADLSGIARPADNPLVEEWTTPYATPPFDRIREAHFIPALNYGIAVHDAEIAAITANPAPPTFENTVVAFEYSGRTLGRIRSVYSGMTSANLTEALAAVQTEAEPLLARHDSAVALNQALFQRIHAVYENRAAMSMTPEQARLLERIHIGFVRNGALLDEAGRTRLAAIDERLSTLGAQFQQNMVADTAAWTMELTARDLEGLPDSVRDAAREAGNSLNRPGVSLITLQRSSVEPFLTYSPRRDLRERAFRAWAARGDNQNQYNNNALIREISQLRLEKARLLGFESWAHYQTADRMAENPQRARELMMRVWAPAVEAVNRDRVRLQQMLRADVPGATLEAWDWRYYAERLRAAEYDLSESEVRPYLQLDNMVAAMFNTAERLWGVTFVPRTDIPVWADGVTAYEVHRGGRMIGLYYLDPYARPTKDSGAWMSSWRDQYRLPNGDEQLPVVYNCLNFNRAAAGQPVLLSWDDATTLFHEFGHSMHGLLSTVTYPTLSGTNVAGDFVEFPSQVYEHWLSTDPILTRYAVNAQGQSIPPALVERIRRAATFNQGWETVEFLGSGIVEMDLALQTNIPANFDANAFERQDLAAIGMPREIIMRHRLPHFGHVFTNDYSAGYYGYLWAEVLEEDAYNSFVSTGNPFDPATAARFCEYIFCAGNLRTPMQAFVGFTGHEPSEAPLLRSRGFPVPGESN